MREAEEIVVTAVVAAAIVEATETEITIDATTITVTETTIDERILPLILQTTSSNMQPPAPPPQRRHDPSGGNHQVTPSTRASSSASSRGHHNRSSTSTSRRDAGDDYHRSLDAPTPTSSAPSGSSSHSRRRYEDRRSATESAQPSSRAVGDSWDIETPLPEASRDDPDANLVNPDNLKDDDDDDDDDSFDRQFYLQEDEGHYVQDQQQMAGSGSGNENDDMGRFLFTNDKIRAREAALEKQRRSGGAGRVSARQSALQDDQDAWEENRLLSSGAAVRGEHSLDNIHTEQDTRVTLLVHQVKPPFLDGRVSFSTVREAVPTVRDASSDFAKKAREGSETLRQLRAHKDKHAMRHRFWELGGTRMGNVVEGTGTGAAADAAAAAKRSVGATDATTADGEIDYKKSSGFASHMKKTENEAVSEFAKKKSIRQQREFLPVYTVREELLNVIRENNVVVIVGETGSGAYHFIQQSFLGRIAVVRVCIVVCLPRF